MSRGEAGVFESGEETISFLTSATLQLEEGGGLSHSYVFYKIVIKKGVFFQSRGAQISPAIDEERGYQGLSVAFGDASRSHVRSVRRDRCR